MRRITEALAGFRLVRHVAKHRFSGEELEPFLRAAQVKLRLEELSGINPLTCSDKEFELFLRHLKIDSGAFIRERKAILDKERLAADDFDF